MDTMRISTAPEPTAEMAIVPVVRPRTELGLLARLAAPIAAVNLGNVLIGAVDTAVVGRLGEVELGAVGLGNAVFFMITIIGLGIMLGLDPLIAQAVGAGEPRRARRLYWQGLYIAGLVGALLTLIVVGVLTLLPLVGIEEATSVHTRSYVYARLPALIPFLFFFGARSYLQALEITRPMVWGVILANLINFPASWLLVFGDAGLQRLGLQPLGIPAMGTAGAGWASSIAIMLQLLIMLVVVTRVSVPPGPSLRRPEMGLIRRALALGAPAGMQLFAEVGGFSVVSVLMGNISSAALAGHQIALTLASLTFMVPLGIGAAAAVRVGHAVGRGDMRGTRMAGLVAIAAGAGFMSLAAIAFWLVPETLASAMTDKPSTIVAAVPLILVAAVFQISDGTQAVAFGALRGAGDTRSAMWANLIGHYLIGLPIGIGLAFGLGMGAVGLWWGLSAGLTVVAVGLTIRFLRVSARPVERV